MKPVQKTHRALITGASAGIGAATALELARQGYRLCLVARRKDRLEQVREKALAAGSPSVDILPIDLLNLESAQKLLSEASDTDILINNAGIGVLGHTLTTPIKSHVDTIILNSVRVIELTHHFANAMKERGFGRIINIASLAAFQSVPYMSSYSGSKALVVQFGESLDSELEGSGVRIVSFCPGGTWTEFMDVAGYSAKEVKKLSRFMQTPETVAQAIVKTIRSPRPIVIPGAINQLSYFLQKFLPRNWLTRSGKKIYFNLIPK